MKLWKKISLGAFVAILAGVLTIVDKSISIYNQVKPKPSEVPENYVVGEKQKAGFIENKIITKARETK